MAFNVGVGERHTLNEIIGLLNKIYGRQAKPRYESPRPGDVRDSLADLTLAREVLGYRPLVSFEEGLKRTAEWYGDYVTESASHAAAPANS